MKNQHTPGPWKIPGTDGGEYVICHKDNSGKQRTVAHVYHEANAHLIASAPELLAAIKSIKEWIEEPIDYQNLPQQIAWANGVAQAAIAKAEGLK